MCEDQDQELSRLEKEWKNRFDRYTSPQPTTENTFQLLARIKETDEMKPADLRAELETVQAAEPSSSKLANLFLSQWNFYGVRSWLLTGIVMLLLTVMINVSAQNEMTGLLAWMKWISLVMIAVMGYAFRSKNKGNDIIEQLSYYSLIHQMFVRFILIMVLQVVITLPLTIVILGKESSVLSIVGSVMPVFFFGVTGFISAMWLGPKRGVMLTLFVWFSQMLLDEGYKAASMFQLPGDEHFLWMNAGILGLSCLLLSTLLYKNGAKRDFG
ncbi:hypothetical protein [Paenibacillus spongiae]|uniref:Uncharacterized protein n=1 Tax=Paenibacillus spongiae TaxID=2909671 RepID=A0ABY5SAL0_9BACL|nr:hypothetical protein [Paenibacillus spongiae]UVI30982.1 hypothetical protein L1F29_03710 [Paenibacillus spongiae]